MAHARERRVARARGPASRGTRSRARHTHAVYKLDRVTGSVEWRLGGRASDFEIADDAVFLKQHDARRSADGTLKVFRGAPLDDPSVARNGNFARGEIELLRRESVAVPASAVVFKDSDSFVQLVEDGEVSTVPVKLGARTDGFVEVLTGLSEGDEVVSRAGTFVADGDMVTPVRGEQMGAIKP